MRLFVKEALASLDPSDCRKLPRPSNGSEWRFLPAQRRSAVDRSLESNGKQLEALDYGMEILRYTRRACVFVYIHVDVMRQLYLSTCKSVCKFRSNWCRYVGREESLGSIINTVTERALLSHLFNVLIPRYMYARSLATLSFFFSFFFKTAEFRRAESTSDKRGARPSRRENDHSRPDSSTGSHL